MTNTTRAAAVVLVLLGPAMPAALAQQQPGMDAPGKNNTDELQQGPLAPAPTPGVAAHRQRLSPGTYMSGATLPDTTLILPPPPLPGSPAQAADDAVFHEARKLQGTARWTLARNDARLDTADVLADFSCALGFAVDTKTAPTLVFLLSHAGADMGPELDRSKNLWKRHRPYVGNDLPICVQRHGSLDDNPSYPSGHTSLEYGAALILAELVPDRAAQILQRGRTLSESRLICGVHWLSDVQGGFLEASSLVAALHGSEKFRADMDRARVEIAAARTRSPAVAPTGNACRIQADAAQHSPLFRTQPAP